MSNDSHETSKRPSKGAPDDDLRKTVERLEAELASLRQAISPIVDFLPKLLEASLAAAHGTEEIGAFMRLLLPEHLSALDPAEVKELHLYSPATRLVLTADFTSSQCSMRKGFVIEAGDPRVKLYGNSRDFQVALATQGPRSNVDAAEVMRHRAAVAVQTKLAEARAEGAKTLASLEASVKAAKDRLDGQEQTARA